LSQGLKAATSALGFLRRGPVPTVFRPLEHPLTGSGSPSEFHQRHTADHAAQNPAYRILCNLLLLPRFLPLQRFANRGEPLTSGDSHSTGYVAPSGFRTLSTLCSPHDLPGLFRPGPAHGVSPFGALLLPALPYALSGAASLLKLGSSVTAQTLFFRA
jgi:hypothetical protein